MTGNTGEGNAADYNNGNFYQEDIFNHFKGGNRGRGQQGQKADFEDILRDLFENGFNPNPNQRQGRQQRSEQHEVSTMNLSVSF